MKAYPVFIVFTVQEDGAVIDLLSVSTDKPLVALEELRSQGYGRLNLGMRAMTVSKDQVSRERRLNESVETVSDHYRRGRSFGGKKSYKFSENFEYLDIDPDTLVDPDLDI